MRLTGLTPVNVATLLPQLVGTVTPNTDPSQATFASSGDAAAQQTIRQAAHNAPASNAAFLALASPTNGQALAQIQALTRQTDALIRLAVGDFTGTT